MAAGRHHADRVVRAVQHRAGECVEAGIDQHIPLAAHLLEGPHLRNQRPRFGGQVTARLYFQAYAVAKTLFQTPPRGIPEFEVATEVGVGFVGLVRHRQTTTSRNRGQ